MRRSRKTLVAITALATLALAACDTTGDLKAADTDATNTQAAGADTSDETADSATTDSDTSEDTTTEDAADEDGGSSELKGLEVTETAFGKDKGSDTWWYVVILDNPNEAAVFDAASIDIEALDKDGTILDSTSDYLTILPGEVALTGSFLDVADGKIKELNVRGPDASSADKVDGEIGDYDVSKVKAKFDEWSTDVSGTVKSTFAEDQELVSVTIVARNAKKKIIGGEMTFIERLPSGGKAQFKTSFLDELPKTTKFTAYAYN